MITPSALAAAKVREVRVGTVHFGSPAQLPLIAGPCVIEDEQSVMRHAKRLAEIAERLGTPVVFKASYDKANRSSVESFRGPGLARGLDILRKVRETFGFPILSDVHCREEIPQAARILDILQIPAFLCRQTDLILEAARTGRVVNVKKGQFLAPWDMKQVVAKIESANNHSVLLTERGATFGYNNLVSDFRAIPILRQTGYPVVFDATHSVQLPGGAGKASGGERQFIATLARAAVAAGADGVFMEVHENPECAKSDGPNAVPLDELEALLEQLMKIREAVV